MKNILFVFLVFSSALFAQQSEKKWDDVITLEKAGKIKSANDIVIKIHKKAIAQKDEVQIIKSFFYQSKYIQILEENAQTKIINNLKIDINRVSAPSKAILNLVYAKCLNDYLSRNDYKIRQRTNTENLNNDFLTWTEKNFNDEINATLNQTLENETLLKNTPLTKYEAIFDYSSSEKFKEESLLTYILKENITLYTSKLKSWQIYKDSFIPYKKELLGKSVNFTKLNFDFVINENLRLVLDLYQKQEISYPTLENRFNRLLFCKSSLFDADNDYLNALNNLQKDVKDEILIQKIQLEKAVIYSQRASKQEHTDFNIKAVSILDSILKINNRSNAYKSALLKKQKILSKSLSVQLQKYIYNNENTRALIQYKNVKELKISFYKINQKQLKIFDRFSKEKDSIVSATLKNKQPITSKTYQLKNKEDYFQYSTEILLPNLQTGTYLVYFESESDAEEKKAFVYDILTSSNLSILASQTNLKETYQVVDRKTGKPLENVEIKSSKFSIKTNKNGVASYNFKKKNTNSPYETLQLFLENDTISISKNYIEYNNDYSKESKGNLKGKIEFYLDRAIYRPGQTVYYKGIAFQKNNEKSSIIPKTTFKIIIEDANDNNFKEFDVTTNEFGSFSGEFVLPKNGLTGNFKITADKPADYEKDAVYDTQEEEHPFWDHSDLEDSEITFRVEEYKRPKFEVSFSPKKESFQINLPIKVIGSAKAFVGSSISDANVTYTVTRYTSYFKNFYGREENEEIADGETKTDASGKFAIDFIATPPNNPNKEKLPIFNYKIKVSVTDINGETHDAVTTIKVGYHDLILGVGMPKTIETKDKNEIFLTSANLNDQYLAVKGEVKIYYVHPFLNKFKPRVWERPEIESISDADFERLFPFEINQNINEEEPKETLVFSKKVDTEKGKKLALDFMSNYKSGVYKIVFSAKDSFNNLIDATETFALKQSKDKFNPSQLFTAQQINADPKKDGFVLIKLTSPIHELYITTAGNYKNQVFFEETNHLQDGEVFVKIPLGNQFEKLLKLRFESVFENHPFDSELTVMLKNEIQKLEWKVESFRNKIQPGSDEKWSFQIKSNNAKKEAEVLASMYDSSLDQFASKEWNSLEFDEYNYNYASRKTILGFGDIFKKLENLNAYSPTIQFNNELTNLIWFGFDFNSPNASYIQSQYLKQISKKAKKPANAKLISGILKDKSGLPLPGVSIKVKDTQRNATSDFDGYYEIEAAIGEELIFSYIGIKTQSVKVTANRIADLTFEDESSKLDEVVVVGYGTQKKKSVTGAIMQVSAAKMTTQEDILFNTESMLAGTISGVQITDNEKRPEYYFRTSKIKFVPGKKIVSGLTSMSVGDATLYIIDGEVASEEIFKKINPDEMLSIDFLTAENAKAIYGEKGANGVIIVTTKKSLEALTQIKARKNLSETAFFYPNLKTDDKGKVSFEFTSPEALTSWKLRLLAHNKEAVSGYLEKNVVTQKELMVLPNFPRFLREKDTIVISAKISNLTAEAKTGIAILQFFDAVTMQPIDSKMLNTKNVKNFTISSFGNTTATWKIAIPEGLQGAQYKILAKAGNYSDGEENILPVLTNNMLVTESIPIWVRDNSKKEYTFENLKNNNSTTLQNHQLTLEYTSNPTWLAIQSLPYLIEYEHECAEQTFARFYANALASEIISSNPKIAGVFENWRKDGKLNSKLEENEELKSIILAETPWLNDAENEEEKKKKLALLFDLEKMKSSQEATFDKLKQKQKASGGFVWFGGDYESEYITRHILAGLGHLEKLSKNDASKIDEIAKTGIPFLDNKFLDYHKERVKNLKASDKLIWINPYSDLHYLYTRSFYLDKYPLSDTLKKASKLYLETAKKDWLNYSLYEKGLAALTLNRFGEKDTAKKIIENLKETSSNNEDWGMYWIANKSGWYWYQAPIETQALLIEAFAEVTKDTKSVDAMKVWLLKNKQTKNWPTTKSTTEAIYALLMQGTDWLSVKDNTVIKLGDEKIITKKLAENEKEAETGYIKLNWKADEVKKEMASISIENKSKVPGFGGVYWQYFEDLDKIKTNKGAVLSVSKELYLKKNTLNGDKLQKITSKNPLKIGDLVTVRLVISTKENVEYIHLKDMRASCFEPVNVLSEYQYKNGLGYYMSTKDAATHFFFDQINKGTYVIEYDVRVNNSGQFSNGITTIESMYAPEFTSHTKGIRVKVN